ncbi:MAG: hypothetical protein HRT90_03975 [Candidatus Margulisbacteria bacterium]|nr:hypothetical protein [Candidatus Margulisiibacteriota bacterium]
MLTTQVIKENTLQVLYVGGWDAPYGIALTFDLLSGIMTGICVFLAIITLLYGFGYTPIKKEHLFKLPLFFFMIAGIQLSFITGDLFNLFVAFEILLIASFGLMSLESRSNHKKYTYPYVALNLVGSFVFLVTIAVTYRLLGTLNFADMGVRSHLLTSDPRLWVMGVMLIFVFGLKGAFFPLYYWLPKSYPILPTPTGAFYAAMLTKVGVYGMIRLFGTVLPHSLGTLHTLVLVLAIPTMLLGILSAFSKKSMRDILCFNLISHIGVIMMGLGLFTKESLTASLFYMIHHMLVIASLFLIAGLIIKMKGSDNIENIGSLWKTSPLLSGLFLIQGLSLSGLPPFSGFWPTIGLIREGLSQGSYILVFSLLASSLLTLLSMVHILFRGFWDTQSPNVQKPVPYFKPMVGVAGILVLVSLGLGLYPEPVLKLSHDATEMVLNQKAYQSQVLP